MKRYSAQSFRGRRALLVQRADDDSRRLARQLERLGMAATVVDPEKAGDAFTRHHDVIVFDADLAWDGLFPWQQAPVPLVALLGSETPGRLELVMGFSVDAWLVKPVRSSGVYSAMVMAWHHFSLAAETRGHVAEIEEKLRARPLVFDSLLKIMQAAECDHNRAYELLRSMAMAERLAVEEVSLLIAGGSPAVLARLLRTARANARRG